MANPAPIIWTALNGTLIFESRFAPRHAAQPPSVCVYLQDRRGEGKTVFVRERKQLRRGCMALLFERCAARVGSEPLAGRPSLFKVNEAHYLHFFDELFERDEMSYRFHTRPAMANAKLALVNDLKSAGAQPAAEPRPVGRPCEPVVPTAMQVIDSSAGDDAWRAP